jgi:hypothetical protein
MRICPRDVVSIVPGVFTLLLQQPKQDIILDDYTNSWGSIVVYYAYDAHTHFPFAAMALLLLPLLCEGILLTTYGIELRIN